LLRSAAVSDAGTRTLWQKNRCTGAVHRGCGRRNISPRLGGFAMKGSAVTPVCLVAVLATSVFVTPAAQQKRMLEPAEYGRWEQLAAQRTPLSPD
jgi:hypothetical protein